MPAQFHLKTKKGRYQLFESFLTETCLANSTAPKQTIAQGVFFLYAFPIVTK